MIVIDVGNSRIKWGQYAEGSLIFQGILPYEKFSVETALSRFFAVEPADVVISNVAGPRVAEVVRQWFVTHWGIEPFFAKSHATWKGIKNGYTAPEALGVDRWCALIATTSRYPQQSLLLVNSGTATTVDVVDAGGQHWGGYIVPGAPLMQRALLEATAITPPFTSNPHKGAPFLATHTVEAYQKGIALMQRAFILEVYRDVTYTLKREPKVVLSGGGADALARELPFSVENIPNLVLEGLILIKKSLETREEGLVGRLQNV